MNNACCVGGEVVVNEKKDPLCHMRQPGRTNVSFNTWRDSRVVIVVVGRLLLSSEMAGENGMCG